jgi:uncharacterized membrane protein YfcA
LPDLLWLFAAALGVGFLIGASSIGGILLIPALSGLADPVLPGKPRARGARLAGFGALVGLGAGLTGVGGPVLSVPLMVVAGFPVLACIGAGQVIQIVAEGMGSLGNLQFSNIR